MGFLFRLITWSILAPFKLAKFLIADVIVFGLIGGTLSVLKAVIKFFFKPILMATLAGGTLMFVFSDEQRRNKVKALIGM